MTICLALVSFFSITKKKKVCANFRSLKEDNFQLKFTVKIKKATTRLCPVSAPVRQILKGLLRIFCRKNSISETPKERKKYLFCHAYNDSQDDNKQMYILLILRHFGQV